MSQALSEIDRWASRRSRLASLVRERGIRGIVEKIGGAGLRGSLGYVSRQMRYSLCIAVTERWDTKRGVDTGGQIEMKDLAIVGPNGAKGAAAVSTSPQTFAFLTRYFPKDRSKITYIDIGAGKGRTLLLASEMGFKRVIGVEFSALLCAKAQENIAQFCLPRGLRNVSVVHADATQYKLPPDPLVMYFCNPFALELWPGMIENIAASLREHPRPMTIAVAGSEPDTIGGVGHLLAGQGRFELIASGKAPYYLDTYRRYHYEIFAARGPDAV